MTVTATTEAVEAVADYLYPLVPPIDATAAETEAAARHHAEKIVEIVAAALRQRR